MGLKENIIKTLENYQLNLGGIFCDEERYKQAQMEMIKKAFIYHISNNKNYGDYCKRAYCSGDWPYSDTFSIKSIPLLPSSFFKRNLNLTTCDEDEVIKYCTSSGTKGSLSIVPRDEETLVDFLGSISSSVSCLFDIERSGNHNVYILGPNPDESGDLWFSYVLSTMALSMNTEYFEHNGYFDISYAANKINKASEDKNIDLLIIGPPFRIVNLCKYINDNNIKVKLNSKSYIISAGGWKDKNNLAISRDEYSKLICDTFHISKLNVRDSFNMVEFNSVFCECECNEKHVLPWTDVYAINPRNNQFMEDGQLGILAFYDGSAYSYPCFIMSEDYGIIHSEKCKCGRIGKRVDIIRRMEGIESRGCALKMATVNTVHKKSSSNRFYNSYYRNPSEFINIGDRRNQNDEDNLEWWKEDKAFYNHVFTIDTMRVATTDTDPVREVNGVVKLLDLKPNSKLLDCPCGFGRHSTLLASRGIDVTGIDINQKFLDFGIETAKINGINITYKNINMLDIRYQNEFDVIINMYSSFGYFDTDLKNFKVLENFYNALKTEGRLLIHLDTPLLQIEERGFDAVKWNGNEWGMSDSLSPSDNATWIVDNYCKKTKRLEGRIKVSGDVNITETYSTRIFSLDEWHDMLQKVGFVKVDFYEDWNKNGYTENSAVMIIIAHKQMI